MNNNKNRCLSCIHYQLTEEQEIERKFFGHLFLIRSEVIKTILYKLSKKDKKESSMIEIEDNKVKLTEEDVVFLNCSHESSFKEGVRISGIEKQNDGQCPYFHLKFSVKVKRFFNKINLLSKKH